MMTRAGPWAHSFTTLERRGACPKESGSRSSSRWRQAISLRCVPTDILCPSEGLWERLAARITEEAGGTPMLTRKERYSERAWEDVGPGISCKVLATDAERDRVSMLVRLEPGAAYPPHTHGGVEELHLLHGELWIEDRKLFPGDYNRAETGTSDQRVWSETGCTCVLITSTRDAFG